MPEDDSRPGEREPRPAAATGLFRSGTLGRQASRVSVTVRPERSVRTPMTSFPRWRSSIPGSRQRPVIHATRPPSCANSAIGAFRSKVAARRPDCPRSASAPAPATVAAADATSATANVLLQTGACQALSRSALTAHSQEPHRRSCKAPSDAPRRPSWSAATPIRRTAGGPLAAGRAKTMRLRLRLRSLSSWRKRREAKDARMMLAKVCVVAAVTCAAAAGSTRDQSASPSYLVMSQNYSANVGVVEIVRDGRILKIVAKGSNLGEASWSADGSALAWLDSSSGVGKTRPRRSRRRKPATRGRAMGRMQTVVHRTQLRLVAARPSSRRCRGRRGEQARRQHRRRDGRTSRCHAPRTADTRYVVRVGHRPGD